MQVQLHDVVVASWTGRDRAAVAARIAELEALGISPPPSAPLLLRIASSRVTTGSTMEVVGMQTTGEAEFVLLTHAGRLWVGLGSDHTDRELEAKSAVLSKQVCDKPISRDFWDFADIESHWESVELRSAVEVAAGKREDYQAGKVSAMLPPRELIAIRDAALTAPDGSSRLLFCGTLATIGPIRPSVRFEAELTDAKRARRLTLAYSIERLPTHLSTSAVHDG